MNPVEALCEAAKEYAHDLPYSFRNILITRIDAARRWLEQANEPVAWRCETCSTDIVCVLMANKFTACATHRLTPLYEAPGLVAPERPCPRCAMLTQEYEMMRAQYQRTEEDMTKLQHVIRSFATGEGPVQLYPNCDVEQCRGRGENHLCNEHWNEAIKA